jgi:hypothetical protein
MNRRRLVATTIATGLAAGGVLAVASPAAAIFPRCYTVNVTSATIYQQASASSPVVRAAPYDYEFIVQSGINGFLPLTYTTVHGWVRSSDTRPSDCTHVECGEAGE